MEQKMGKIHMMVRNMLFNDIKINERTVDEPYKAKSHECNNTASPECSLAFIDKHYQNTLVGSDDSPSSGSDVNTKETSTDLLPENGMAIGTGLRGGQITPPGNGKSLGRGRGRKRPISNSSSTSTPGRKSPPSKQHIDASFVTADPTSFEDVSTSDESQEKPPSISKPET